MDKEYPDYVQEMTAVAPDLAAQVAGWHGLESVLTWMQSLHLPSGSIDLIGQDEFEYDFLIALQPCGRWLAFGVT